MASCSLTISGFLPEVILSEIPLFLGRRSCPPEAGMVLGIRDLPLETALEEEPWQGPEWKKEKMPLKLPMFIECAPDDPTVLSLHFLKVHFPSGGLQILNRSPMTGQVLPSEVTMYSFFSSII